MIALHKVIWIALVILWIIKESGALLPEPRGSNRLTYTWEKLLQLGSSMVCRIKPSIVLPAEIRPRKRGRRGGVRTRLRRRPFKPPLQCLLLVTLIAADSRASCRHFNNMWTFRQEGGIFWTYAMEISLTRTSHRLDRRSVFQITMLFSCCRTTNRY